MTVIKLIALIILALMSGFSFGFLYGSKSVAWRMLNVCTKYELLLVLDILKRKESRSTS